MNAIQFIQQHGVEKAREVVEGAPTVYIGTEQAQLCYRAKDQKYSTRFKPSVLLVNVSNLKRLVDRLELIERLGGINEAAAQFIKYQHLGESCFQEYLQCSSRALEQAIADYEAIGGEHV